MGQTGLSEKGLELEVLLYRLWAKGRKELP